MSDIMSTLYEQHRSHLIKVGNITWEWGCCLLTNFSLELCSKAIASQLWDSFQMIECQKSLCWCARQTEDLRSFMKYIMVTVFIWYQVNYNWIKNHVLTLTWAASRIFSLYRLSDSCAASIAFLYFSAPSTSIACSFWISKAAAVT